MLSNVPTSILQHRQSLDSLPSAAATCGDCIKNTGTSLSRAAGTDRRRCYFRSKTNSCKLYLLTYLRCDYFTPLSHFWALPFAPPIPCLSVAIPSCTLQGITSPSLQNKLPWKEEAELGPSFTCTFHSLMKAVRKAQIISKWTLS